MTDTAQIQSAIASLRSDAATNVSPLSDQLAQLATATAADQQKLARVEQLRSDARAATRELQPIKADLDARKARNEQLRARLAALRSGRP